MSTDLTGLSSADRVPRPTASGSFAPGATSTSSALTRIAPVDPAAPRAPVATPTNPLGRSGLDLFDVLATTDVVAQRQSSGSVAVDVGLEQARGSLLRNLPADALSALDLVWDGAQRTEEGWYLRSGSLTVLGLPGESERIAQEGLVLRPTSLALRFMQSLSLAALGDLSGARSVLAPALLRSPAEPLLLVQQALVQARQGDVRAAEAALTHIAVPPEHPALIWGRATLRTIVADTTRQRSRPTPIDWPVAIPAHPQDTVRATPITSDIIFGDITGATDVTHASTDVSADALERFGARLVTLPLAEMAREARMLMRAFSAGGTLALSTSAEQAHAARTILTAFLGVASGEGAETPLPVRAMIEQLVTMLQHRRFDDAERMLRRQSVLAREPIGRLLFAIVRGGTTFEAPHTETLRAESPSSAAISESPHTPAFSIAAARVATPSASMLPVRGDLDRAPVVPVRLGLGLLDAASSVASGSLRAVPNAESTGEGWGAANAAPLPPTGNEWSDGAGVRAVALVCVALAAAALLTSHGAVAIGLAVGAVWLGLRRSGREGDGSRTHDRSPPQ